MMQFNDATIVSSQSLLIQVVYRNVLSRLYVFFSFHV